ncbi:hypothetical protein [Virgibacillus sp. MG-45]|uniref:hypothetical protein n=1 Tax=Virgibacillus sp. MG-45 TaxID=3102791 RepID=UPI002ED9BFD3
MEKLMALMTEIEQKMNNTERKINEKFMHVQQGSTICYFTHSIIINQEPNNSHLILASFHVMNETSFPFHEPIILLHLDSDGDIDFSGKYTVEGSTNTRVKAPWVRVLLEDHDPQTHYCFKPTTTNLIAPKSGVSFQNFQIKLPFNQYVNVNGYYYCEEQKEGIASLNTLQINH